MILWLLLAQLSTPLNLNGQPITRASCDGGIVCTKMGQTLTIIGDTKDNGKRDFTDGQLLVRIRARLA